jgi:predicted GH43/DUF377 family glycosyl hydrolase
MKRDAQRWLFVASVMCLVCGDVLNGEPTKDSFPDWAMGPFEKQLRPVLSPSQDSEFHCPVEDRRVRWEQQNVYNPAAVVRDDKVHLLYRADDGPKPTAWGRTCRIGLAVSEDGRNFVRRVEPVLFPSNDAFRQYEWEGGCEDLHIVEGEDGTYYMNYTAWNGKRDSMQVASSKDLIHWTKHGPAFAQLAPDRVWRTRSGVVLSQRIGSRLVAKRFNGKYLMYVTMSCWLAESQDLINWKPVDPATAVWPNRVPGAWNGSAHEAGAIALALQQGILLMYNGAPAGSSDYPGCSWLLGQAMLDPQHPSRVQQEMERPFLHAETDWEKKGFTDGATVSNTLVPFRRQWLLYYGAADRHIGLAVFTPPEGSIYCLTTSN